MLASLLCSARRGVGADRELSRWASAAGGDTRCSCSRRRQHRARWCPATGSRRRGSPCRRTGSTGCTTTYVQQHWYNNTDMYNNTASRQRDSPCRRTGSTGCTTTYVQQHWHVQQHGKAAAWLALPTNRIDRLHNRVSKGDPFKLYLNKSASIGMLHTTKKK